MEQQTNQQPTPQNGIPQDSQAPVVAEQTMEKQSSFNRFKNEVLKGYESFKKNKYFKVIVGLFAFMLFIVIAGTIYRISHSAPQVATATPSPRPVPTREVIFTEESKKSKSEIELLREDVKKLDIEQKYLTPPTVNFDIKF